MFLHAGPLHIAFNLWAFWSVGKLTERIFGNIAFLAIYVLSGFGAALTSLAVKPFTVSVGASGAIFGVYGALLAFVALHRGVFPAAYLAQQRNSIIGFLGYNVIFGLTQPQTDMAAHVGGFIIGAISGALLSRDVLAPSTRRAARAASGVGLAVLLVITAFAVRAHIAAAPEIKADRSADEGFAHIKAERYPEAIEAYSQALEFKAIPTWLNARGFAYLKTDKLDLAERDLLAAKASKETEHTSEFLCEVYVRRNAAADHDAMMRECGQAIDESKTPKEKALLLAMRGYAQQPTNKDAALADADAALLIDPNQYTALTLRVDLRRARGELDLAEADCTALLADASAQALAVCANVAEARHDRRATRERLDRALELEPTNATALFTRAWLNTKDERFEESLRDYDALVAARPDFANALNGRAWMKVVLGDFAGARVDADRAVEIDPNSPYFQGTRCFARMGLDDRAGARADCARAVELGAENVDRGMLAFIDGRYGEARRYWQKAIEEDPSHAAALRPWIAKLPPDGKHE
jgi:tetratricopeptide (TPR) repeat protein